MTSAHGTIFELRLGAHEFDALFAAMLVVSHRGRTSPGDAKGALIG